MGENNFVSDFMNGIIERQKAANPPEECDYVGEDGYLYCGKCNTRKEYEVEFGGTVHRVPTVCECKKQEIARKEELERKRMRTEQVKAIKKNSLMDKRFESCNFDTMVVTDENSRPFKICKRYAEKFAEMMEKNQGLLLYGGVGTGKTHLACCIGNHLMENLTPVIATSFIKILQKAKSFKDIDDEESFIERMNLADLLILDDLGAERSTDYAMEIVYNIIDSRYRIKKPMIVTTNLSLHEMQSTTDLRYMRIYDRIFETCYPVEFTGSSWRIREAADRFDQMKKTLEG